MHQILDVSFVQRSFLLTNIDMHRKIYLTSGLILAFRLNHK